MSIQHYLDSRPFAILEINHQIQHEFYSTLAPPDHPINSGLPFGMLFVLTNMKFNCRPILLNHILDIYVTAKFQFDEIDRMDFYIGFHIPRALEVTGKTRDLIEEKLTGYIDAEDKFNVLHFLIAVDRVVMLDMVLDWGEEDHLKEMDLAGRTVEDLIGHGSKFFFVEMVMKRDGGGVAKIDIDSTVV